MKTTLYHLSIVLGLAGGGGQRPAADAPAPENPASPGFAEQLLARLREVELDPRLVEASEREVVDLVARLAREDRLQPLLVELLRQVPKDALPRFDQVEPEAYADQLVEQIEAQLQIRGRTAAAGDPTAAVYESWEVLNERLTEDVGEKFDDRNRGDRAALEAVLEEFTGVAFLAGNRVEPLIDGPQSFALRDRLIDGARHSIYVMVWAFYDDGTGEELVDRLIARKTEDPALDVRVVVDGQVADKEHHREAVRRLEEDPAGVAVLRWRSADPLREYEGTHRKMIIVDGSRVVAGGMNVGDWYSHRNTDWTWRDTDVTFTGPAVRQALELFATVWNEQVETRDAYGPPAHPRLDPEDVWKATAGYRSQDRPGDARVAVVDHTPAAGDENVLLTTLAAIEWARESIDIENAYILPMPIFHDAIARARERGVRVRIHTNSATSIDEAIISVPNLQAMQDFTRVGVEVYLKRGKNTVHSKFMLVDGVYAWVGSYNLHPRSYRLEGEMIVSILDEGFAAELGAAFEHDLRDENARKCTRPEDIEVQPTLVNTLIARYFWDLL